jgi:hypothetical protein
MRGKNKEWLAMAGALVLFAALPVGSQEPADAGHGEEQHAGHDHGTAPSGGAHAEPHAGHPSSAGEDPAVASSPAPVAVAPEQPAKTLQPDALDAPAATSVVEAQRSAEMARGMTGDHGGHGGHGGHGVGRYRHVDAGRGPEATQEADEPPAAGAGSHQHGHGSAAPAPGQEQEHSHEEASTLYVCPMHPDVTSDKPGTCPKCGMALVERRKE